MKKLLSLVLTVAMAFSLAACGGSGAATGSGTVSTANGGNEDGYELTMWLFQDWTVGTAAEIFNT